MISRLFNLPWNNRKEYSELHKRFRESYMSSQIRMVLIINLFMLFYSVIAYFFTGQYITLDINNCHLQYGVLFVISTLGSTGFWVTKTKHRFVTAGFAYECYVLYCSILYSLWGILVMYVSVMEGRSTDFVTGTIVIVVSCTLFNYGMISLNLIFITVTVGYLYITFRYIENPDPCIILNVSALAFVLYIICFIKYVNALKEWLNREQILSLQKELVNNNEQLTANNEEMIAINEDLVLTKDKLSEALETQKMFTAAMNHELRTPLNGVIGCLQMLSISDNISNQNRIVIKRAMSSSNTLLQLVNDLLDYAKIEAGKFEINDNFYDLREIVVASTSIFVNAISEKNLRFVIDIDDNTPCGLYGDGARIQQVMTNFLSNAVKYTQSGYVKLYIKVSDNNLHVEVEDSGEGISEDAMESLFKPFRRINEGEHRKIQGTGLGLYITYSLVTQMKGTIEVKSTFGKGSTFIVDIPTKIIDKNLKFVRKDEMLNKSTTDETIDCTSKKFLYVDDIDMNLEVFKCLAESSTGAEVVVCQSGEAALKELVDKAFDILFFDHLMPEMDGIELLEKVRGAGIETPAVILTANSSDEDVKMYEEKGFDSFLGKPLKLDEMISVIKKVL